MTVLLYKCITKADMEVKLLRILAPIILLSVILPTVDVGSDLYLIYEFFSGGLATCSVPTAHLIDICFENSISNCDYYYGINNHYYYCVNDIGLKCEEMAQARVIECRKYSMCYCASNPEHCALHRDFGSMLLGK